MDGPSAPPLIHETLTVQPTLLWHLILAIIIAERVITIEVGWSISVKKVPISLGHITLNQPAHRVSLLHLFSPESSETRAYV